MKEREWKTIENGWSSERRKEVKEQPLELAGAYGTDEIMAVTITHDFQDRLDSYRPLAEAFHQSI